MKTAAIDILHDEEDLLMGFKDFEQLGDVVMVELLHNLHFTFDRLASVRLHQLCLFIYFDSDLLVQGAMQS